jgi:hypothetical protein
MKVVLVFFLLTVVCLPTPAQQTASDSERAGLMGRVCIVAEGRLNPPPTVGDLGFATRRTYSQEGRLLEINAPSLGLSRTIETFERVDNNTVLMHRAHVGVSNAEPLLLAWNPDTDSSGNELYRIQFGTNRHYERTGDRVTLKVISVQETLKTRDRLIWRKLYLFDPQGRLMEEMEVQTNDLIVSQTLYNYDTLSARAPVYVETHRDGITNYKAWYIYEVDSKGNWIRRTRIKEEPSIPSSPPNNITYRTITYCS